MAGLLLIAVLYFDNNTPDKDFELLKKGMADMLITDLTGVEGVQVLERARLESLIGELKLQRSKYFDPKTAQKLGQGLGATHAITGSFSSAGDDLRIDVRLIEIGSGKVITTDKVTGKKAEFFALEQRLTSSFACALQPKTCREEEENDSASEAPLPAILRYSKALELADGGNLEDASKEMKGAMADAPSFPIAKARYLEIMKRLYAAKDVRTTELSANEKRLTAKIDQVLADAKAPLARALGYRILRGQILLHRIDVLCSQPSPDVKAFRDLVIQYRDNQLKLIDRVGADPPDPEIDEADQKAGEELGLGDEPGNLDFYDATQVQRDLGSFLTTGKEPFWGTFRWSQSLQDRVRVDSGVRISGKAEFRDVPRPPMKRLGSEFAGEGLKLFDAALARSKDQKATIDTLDAHAQALFELGRPEDAIAKWQTILERFPKYENYADIEAKVRAALGASR